MIYSENYDKEMRLKLSENLAGKSYSRRFYLAFGGRPVSNYSNSQIEKWLEGSVPVSTDTTEVQNILYLKESDKKGFVKEIKAEHFSYEKPDNIATNDGKYWQILGEGDFNKFSENTEDITRNLYFSFRLSLDDISDGTVLYQIGLFYDTKTKTGSSPTKSLLKFETDTDKYNIGTFVAVSNIAPVVKSKYTREVFDFVLSF
ncbi:hypothetical protein ThvES_00008010 [Thiovulum sp. ES]|nr:hypothetical protein ThvES_00008010 [Thiovulum sp. ES]